MWPSGLLSERVSLEKNGFTIIDFTEDLDAQMFSWKMDEPDERLNNLEPFHTFSAARRM